MSRRHVPVLDLTRGKHIQIMPHDVHDEHGMTYHHSDQAVADAEVSDVWETCDMAVVGYGSVLRDGPMGAVCYDRGAIVLLAGDAA